MATAHSRREPLSVAASLSVKLLQKLSLVPRRFCLGSFGSIIYPLEPCDNILELTLQKSRLAYRELALSLTQVAMRPGVRRNAPLRLKSGRGAKRKTRGDCLGSFGSIIYSLEPCDNILELTLQKSRLACRELALSLTQVAMRPGVRRNAPLRLKSGRRSQKKNPRRLPRVFWLPSMSVN